MNIIGRDEIALEAMKCLLSNKPSIYPEFLARRSYELAEAMLTERNIRLAASTPLSGFGKKFIADPAPTVQKE